MVVLTATGGTTRPVQLGLHRTLKVSQQLNRSHCTPQQARAGLVESAARCAEMVAEVLASFGGRGESLAETAGLWPGPVGFSFPGLATCHLSDPLLISTHRP
jgi:hypothetical protein